MDEQRKLEVTESDYKGPVVEVPVSMLAEPSGFGVILAKTGVALALVIAGTMCVNSVGRQLALGKTEGVNLTVFVAGVAYGSAGLVALSLK